MVRLRLYWRRYRRLFICRLLAFSITGTLLCLLVLSTKATSHPLPNAESPSAGASRLKDHVSLAGPRHGLKRESQMPIVEHSYRAGQRKTSESFPGPGSAQGDLLSTIKELDHIMSDDMRTKTLLDPLYMTGESLVRDLAYRVRAFKTAFATWESLHVMAGKALRGREDIVRDLSSSRLSRANRNSAIHTYDSFRHFISSFANRLFPYTTKFLGDHMSLHFSFYNGGRGIVLTAGDRQAPYLHTLIPSFRKLGCELPIEILYLGEDDLGEDNRDRLEALDNVLTRDLTKMVDDEGWTLAGMLDPFFDRVSY